MIGPMELDFIVTWIVILLVGTGGAFLGEWIFRKDNERNEQQDEKEN